MPLFAYSYADKLLEANSHWVRIVLETTPCEVSMPVQVKEICSGRISAARTL